VGRVSIPWGPIRRKEGTTTPGEGGTFPKLAASQTGRCYGRVREIPIEKGELSHFQKKNRPFRVRRKKEKAKSSHKVGMLTWEWENRHYGSRPRFNKERGLQLPGKRNIYENVEEGKKKKNEDERIKWVFQPREPQSREKEGDSPFAGERGKLFEQRGDLGS